MRAHRGSLFGSLDAAKYSLCVKLMQVLKIEDHEANDVVATLVGQVLQRGYRVVIASPDLSLSEYATLFYNFDLMIYYIIVRTYYMLKIVDFVD
ncbi:hypothetical protein L1049_007703 [Liquidambar formosana]|uniref:Uncharacterized protein n=1 Tax=Liquidambar formosana TaxID=63359 RepID=A0AAP0S890_LIQFO